MLLDLKALCGLQQMLAVDMFIKGNSQIKFNYRKQYKRVSESSIFAVDFQEPKS